ncbi:MAG TPA: transposase [Pirellulales bacterium]|jgi:REP element-mobilizing transposase RayT|nr:transposase [Pirellulales bacterium]
MSDRFTTWNLPPPPGFRGFDDQREVTIYRRRLPHWRQDGATYFVTYRLGDSLPAARLRELDALWADWARLHPPPRSRAAWERITRARAARIERWLDELHGSCLLAQQQCAEEVVQAMRYFDGRRYELASYVVMPNHVHALVTPTQPKRHPLERIVGGWKQRSSSQIGIAAQTDNDERGGLWQRETHDGIVRDEEHLYRVLRYIGNNPSKAGLAREACLAWVRPDWQRAGWTFDMVV